MRFNPGVRFITR